MKGAPPQQCANPAGWRAIGLGWGWARLQVLAGWLAGWLGLGSPVVAAEALVVEGHKVSVHHDVGLVSNLHRNRMKERPRFKRFQITGTGAGLVWFLLDEWGVTDAFKSRRRGQPPPAQCTALRKCCAAAGARRTWYCTGYAACDLSQRQ